MECTMNMLKKYLVISLLVLGISSIFMITGSAETLWVDDDYHYPNDSDGSLSKPFVTIQSAINAADNGDIIKILSGTYNEDIVIDKSVSLRTEFPAQLFRLKTTGNLSTKKLTEPKIRS